MSAPATRFAIAFAALAGTAGVMLAAWSAHGMADGAAATVKTAAMYALLHGLAMIGGALFFDRLTGKWARRFCGAALILFAAGILMFSGGLTLSALGTLTGVAPVGGICLIAGWLALAAGAIAAK